MELSAPEMAAQIAEAQSKAQSAEADRLQAAAQLAAAGSTYQHLKTAAETPGAIAGNELEVAQQQVAAARALLASREQASQAAQASVHSLTGMQTYLKIRAPFSGMVTERMVHPGALVGPGADAPLLTIQQISRLRLVVSVPEEDLGTMATGSSIAFTVPAAPDKKYSGTLARVAHSLDEKTRAMAVELDVPNRDLALAPGMYPAVKWPIRSTRPALFVPKTSVVTTTERTFVVRNNKGKAEWVDVRKGPPDGDLVEVAGDLREKDEVVRRATDEFRDGAALSIAHPLPASK